MDPRRPDYWNFSTTTSYLLYFSTDDGYLFYLSHYGPHFVLSMERVVYDANYDKHRAKKADAAQKASNSKKPELQYELDSYYLMPRPLDGYFVADSLDMFKVSAAGGGGGAPMCSGAHMPRTVRAPQIFDRTHSMLLQRIVPASRDRYAVRMWLDGAVVAEFNVPKAPRDLSSWRVRQRASRQFRGRRLRDAVCWRAALSGNLPSKLAERVQPIRQLLGRICQPACVAERAVPCRYRAVQEA
jgi:hypothetical protein